MSNPRRRRQGREPRTPSAPSRVGERLTLEVENVAHGGHCVARHEGRVVFVRHTLPGEKVVAEITDGTTTSRFLRADAVEVLRASPHRVDPPCPWSGPGRCGGCDWQHVAVAHQRELKAAAVAEQLRRIAHIDRDVVVEKLPGADDGLHWRTRVELAIDRQGRSGFRAHRSHRIVAVDDCLIAAEGIADTGVFDGSWPPGVKGVEAVAPSEGHPVMVTLPELDEPPPVTELVRTERHGSHRFALGARSFWQVHPGAAATFVDHVMDELAPAPGERVLDLYCGVGVFAAFLAQAVGAGGEHGVVVGVEGDERAAEDADANMAGDTVRLVCGDVGEVLASPVVAEELGQAGGPADVDLVVLDPPRAGAGKEVMQRLALMSPRAIAYVACDPAALARDLSYAAELGYELDTLRAFDAFPMTHHVECIATLRPAD